MAVLHVGNLLLSTHSHKEGTAKSTLQDGDIVAEENAMAKPKQVRNRYTEEELEFAARLFANKVKLSKLKERRAFLHLLQNHSASSVYLVFAELAGGMSRRPSAPLRKAHRKALK